MMCLRVCLSVCTLRSVQRRSFACKPVPASHLSVCSHACWQPPALKQSNKGLTLKYPFDLPMFPSLNSLPVCLPPSFLCYESAEPRPFITSIFKATVRAPLRRLDALCFVCVQGSVCACVIISVHVCVCVPVCELKPILMLTGSVGKSKCVAMLGCLTRRLTARWHQRHLLCVRVCKDFFINLNTVWHLFVWFFSFSLVQWLSDPRSAFTAIHKMLKALFKAPI